MIVNSTEARKLIANELRKRKLRFRRIQAKTVSFQDLARVKKVFVDAYGCDPAWHGNHMEELKAIARDNEFIVQFHTTL
jgi:hypothetical protein